MLPLPVSIHLHLSFGCGRITVSRSSTRCGHLFAGPGGGFALFQVALQHGEVFAEKPLKFRDGRILTSGDRRSFGFQLLRCHRERLCCHNLAQDEHLLCPA